MKHGANSFHFSFCDFCRSTHAVAGVCADPLSQTTLKKQLSRYVGELLQLRSLAPVP